MTFDEDERKSEAHRIARQAAAAVMLGLPVKRVSLEGGVELEDGTVFGGSIESFIQQFVAQIDEQGASREDH